MRRLLVFLFLTTQAFGAFSYYRALTVDHTKCGASDSSNFPVLVSISHATLKAVANGGHIQQTTTQSAPPVTMPADLIFSADSSGITKYPWEVESYDGTNGILIAWVKIPTVSHTLDTKFYMVYGDVTISTPQNTGINSPANVWDADYRLVAHLPGATPSVTDSTGITSPSNSGLTATTGKMDGGAASTGGANKLSITQNLYTLINNSATHTVSFWVKTSSRSNSPVLWDGATGTTLGAYFEFGSVNNAYWGYNGSTRYYNPLTTSCLDGAWCHITLVKTGSGDNGIFYINAVVQATIDHSQGTGTLGDPANSGNTYLFNYHSGSYGLNGSLDEIRISDIARSADWVLQEYNNQNAPGNIGADNFLKFGAELTPQAAGGAIRHAVRGGE
jgi:Concanavalin A-like lectin/glucanases superfamily